MNEDDLSLVLSAVVTLLRRRSAEDTLCCSDENFLRVKSVDQDGFVTVVACTSCSIRAETVCHDVSWTYEKVRDKSRLTRGDHICWHRPCAIWHHAIVTDVAADGKTQIVHYSRNMMVEETVMAEGETCCSSLECNSLYRVNYDVCYNTEYTVMRAKKLLGETR